jgi:hypothetical protein
MFAWCCTDIRACLVQLGGNIQYKMGVVKPLPAPRLLSSSRPPLASSSVIAERGCHHPWPSHPSAVHTPSDVALVAFST